MRFVFVTPPVRAHLNAAVPLAWVPRGAGHETVLTTGWGPERELAR